MNKLYGVTVAMTTPFNEAGEVDYPAMRQLTCNLIDKGVHCLYPCGTTGEMIHLTADERKKLAETVVEAAAGRVRVYIHCGAVQQSETVELMRHAQQIGADGVGVVTPMFLKADKRELEAYYVSLSANVSKDFPIYLYNIPQCSGNDLDAETVRKIAERCPNVVGIKYSFADMNRLVDYIEIEGLSVLHGCDRIFPALLALGCEGTVSGVAGVFPEPFVAVYEAYQAGDWGRVRQLQKICIRFCDLLRCGSNMSYFKEALKLRGLPGGHMRAPQLDLAEKDIQELQKELIQLCKLSKISLLSL